MTQKKKFAIIGAGISGLVCAYQLHDIFDITIFEKSRGVSGRSSTRYAGQYEFDHGAPYFTARSKKFQKFLKSFEQNNVLTQWKPKILSANNTKKPFKSEWFEPHYMGYSRMNGFAKALLGMVADTITLSLGTEIQQILTHNKKITLNAKDNKNFTDFDALIITAPAAQAQNLLPETVSFLKRLDNVTFSPLYSLMIGTPEALDSQAGIYQYQDPIIDKIIINSDKPNRPNNGTSLLVQSTAEWAQTHINADLAEKEQFLCQHALLLLNKEDMTIDYLAVHRWRYGKVSKPLEKSFLLDADASIGVCGDWCIDAQFLKDESHKIQGIEAAFLSAEALCTHLQSIEI